MGFRVKVGTMPMLYSDRLQIVLLADSVYLKAPREPVDADAHYHTTPDEVPFNYLIIAIPKTPPQPEPVTAPVPGPEGTPPHPSAAAADLVTVGVDEGDDLPF